jgi:hypothetical protein
VNGVSWKVIVEAASAVAILAGLIFVGLQMRQTQAISTAELQQEMISSRISLSEIVVENSDLLAKANAGDELSASEEIALDALVISHWGDAFFGQRRWTAVDHSALNAPVRAFAIFLHENPGAMRVWNKRQPKMADSRILLGGSSGIQDAFDAQVETYLLKLKQASE